MWDEILPTAEWVKSNMPQVRTHTFTQIGLTNFKHKVTLTCKEFCPVKVISITDSRDSVILVIDVDFFEPLQYLILWLTSLNQQVCSISH